MVVRKSLMPSASKPPNWTMRPASSSDTETRSAPQPPLPTSGSESADTALAIALAYHRANGEAHRTRFIGRERGYHGVGFGGISVGGISPNRKTFASALLPGVDHMPHTHSLEHNSFTRGQP